MTLRQLLEKESYNEQKFNFCIYIKEKKYDLITTTKEITFNELIEIVGLFLLCIEIEDWQEFEK